MRVIPGPNHGLFETKTGKRLVDELPNLERFSPEYMSLLMNWMKEVTAR